MGQRENDTKLENTHLLLKNKLPIGKYHLLVFNMSINSDSILLFLQVALLPPVVVFLLRKIMKTTWARLLLLRNFFQILSDLYQFQYRCVGWFKKHSFMFRGQSVENLIFYEFIICFQGVKMFISQTMATSQIYIVYTYDKHF